MITTGVGQHSATTTENDEDYMSESQETNTEDSISSQEGEEHKLNIDRYIFFTSQSFTNVNRVLCLMSYLCCILTRTEEDEVHIPEEVSGSKRKWLLITIPVPPVAPAQWAPPPPQVVPPYFPALQEHEYRSSSAGRSIRHKKQKDLEKASATRSSIG